MQPVVIESTKYARAKPRPSRLKFLPKARAPVLRTTAEGGAAGSFLANPIRLAAIQNPVPDLRISTTASCAIGYQISHCEKFENRHVSRSADILVCGFWGLSSPQYPTPGSRLLHFRNRLPCNRISNFSQ